nr:NAD(P)-dependent oxidoreductase [uncultured Acetatifactor sp.]
MKKIIIIGATGETGMYITDYFCRKAKGEFEIIAAGLRKTQFFDRYNIPYYSIDIGKKEAFQMLPQKDVFAVIYTAAVMPGRMKGYNPMLYLETNVCGTLNVLEYCRKVRADRIIFTQTIRDLGNKIGKEIITADAARDFSYKGDHAVYVISKNAAVDLIEHYYQEYGLKRFIFRLPTIYMYTPNKYYCVNGERKIMGFRYMIDQAISGADIELWGEPEKAHDILYVKDLAYLFYLACKSSLDGGMYNAGTGKPITLLEQIKGMIQVFGSDQKKSKIIYCPEKGSARQYTIDISKTQRELGYEPQYGYIDYLKDFKTEMEDNRFADLFQGPAKTKEA